MCLPAASRPFVPLFATPQAGNVPGRGREQIGEYVKDFIELNGASGRAYRFRRWRPGAGHLPIAGNYAVVQGPPGGFTVLAAAAVDDLSRVQLSPEAADLAGQVHVFTRLNVARALREAEADDIAAFYGLGPAPSLRDRG